MLKRQRPASPPPTFSSVPLVVVDPPADLLGQDTKRRRTLPPVLDGACRGWAQAPLNNVVDDDDEYDNIENIAPNFSVNCSLTERQQSGEYASANSFLRELHTLQQHRLLFSSPPSPPSASALLPCGSSSKDDSHSLNILPYSGYHVPLTKGPPLPLPIEGLRVPLSHISPTPISKLSQQSSDGFPIDEIQSVTEHYEGTNKFLGLLFLSRRRVLDLSDRKPGS